MCFHNTLPQDSGSRDTNKGKGGKKKNAKGKSKASDTIFRKKLRSLMDEV